MTEVVDATLAPDDPGTDLVTAAPARETYVCKGCGGKFTRQRQQRNSTRTLCRSCSLKGERHPRWAGNRAEVYICEGCGETFTRKRAARNLTRNRCRACAVLRGPNHPNWRSGLVVDDGRLKVLCRDGTHMTYARALMCAHVGRVLDPTEHVHHVNGDKTDDRLENLQIMDHREHGRLHGGRSGMGA